MSAADSVSRKETRPPQPLSSEAKRALNNEKTVRVFFQDNVGQWLESDRIEGQKWVKIYTTISAVISVALAFFTLGILLGTTYLPAWAPWAVGVPLFIGLMVAKVKLETKITDYKRQKEFAPLLKEFTEHHTVQAIQPLGESDLPPVDERLKSDRTGLGRSLPPSGKNVARLAQELDLEVTPYLQAAAAMGYTGMPHEEANWTACKKWHSELLEAARKGDATAFEAARHGLKAQAHRVANPDLEYLPYIEELGHFTSLAKLYHRSRNQADELNKLRQEGEVLYGNSFTGLFEYVEMAKRIETAITPMMERLGRNDIPALLALQELVSPMELYRLLEATDRLKKELQSWIARHPTKQYEALHRRLQRYRATDDLALFEIRYLAEWRALHPAEAKKKIEDIHPTLYPHDLRAWLDRHPEMCVETVDDLYATFTVPKEAQVDLLRTWVRGHREEAGKPLTSLRKASLWKDLAPLFAAQPDLRFKTPEDLFIVLFDFRKKAREAYEAFQGIRQEDTQSVARFVKEVMTPFDLFVAFLGETSKPKLVRALQAGFTSRRAIPFLPETTSKDPAIRERRVEEIRLNALIKKMDAKMVFTHRARIIGLQIPLMLLLIVEAVVTIYFGPTKIMWAFAALNVVNQGIYYLVDKRLKRLDQEKRTAKLQHLLRNHPTVGFIPGSRPRLQALKEVQNKYGLEGVRPTWARILAEEADTPFEELKKCAETGSKQADRYLQDAIIHLEQQVSLLHEKRRVANRQEKEDIQKQIKRCNKRIALYKKTLSPEPKEKKTAQGLPRIQLAQTLDRHTRWTVQTYGELAKLRHRQAHFERLQQILPSYFFTRIVARQEMEGYLNALPDGEIREKAEACRLLLALQSGEYKTPEAVLQRSLVIEGKMREVERSFQQKVDKSGALYEPLARARQLVQEACDRLVEEKSENEIREKHFRQKSREFAQTLPAMLCGAAARSQGLEVSAQLMQLAMSFVAQPVSQAEIDLIWESLNTPLLVQEPGSPPIEVLPLLFAIRESRKWAFGNVKKYVHETSLPHPLRDKILALRMVPPQCRLELAHILTRLQSLQADELYVDQGNVEIRAQSCRERIGEIDHELTLLNQMQERLSITIRQLS